MIQYWDFADLLYQFKPRMPMGETMGLYFSDKPLIPQLGSQSFHEKEFIETKTLFLDSGCQGAMLCHGKKWKIFFQPIFIVTAWQAYSC